MKIAVLGAGLTGSLAALELAESGHDVVLYDRCAQPFSGASLGCEGKIHLGYVYALDRSLRTARMMIRGAFGFRPLVERWTGSALFDTHLSAPFLYAVPADSMMSPDAIRNHFHGVRGIILDQSRDAGSAANCGEWSELSCREMGAIFDPSQVATAFRTQEQAIDTTALAPAIRKALASAPRLTLCMRTTITGVAEDGNKLTVTGHTGDGALVERFDSVVNALWEHRVHIDATFGLHYNRPLMHRYKLGLFTRDRNVIRHTPNVTFLIGSYGDSVAFRDNAYLSWYPVGLISQETALRPAIQDFEVNEDLSARIIAETLQNLRRLMPGGAQGFTGDPAVWTLKGGFVTAWGDTGITDCNSELHERHAVGVHSMGRYHSIDTGKLTLSPVFAAEACARINNGWSLA